jgi:outer membrane protein insertion porin family
MLLNNCTLITAGFLTLFFRSLLSRIRSAALHWQQITDGWVIITILMAFMPFNPLFSQVDSPPIIRKIEFRGDFKLSERKLRSLFTIKEKRPYDTRLIPAAAENLINALQNEGHFFARIDSIRTIVETDPSEKILLVYGRSGEPVLFGNITILCDSLSEHTYKNKLTIRKDDPYLPRRLESDIRVLLRLAADQGYPFARADVGQIRFSDSGGASHADIELRIREGNKVFISNIEVKGNSYTRDAVILRELNIARGVVYQQDRVDNVPQRLNRLDIFQMVKEAVPVITATDSVILQVEVEEGNATSFDGVVGYIPEQGIAGQSRGYFTGLINLSFRNLFGTARKFEVYWQRPDQLSEEFRLFYTEPWVFNYPLHASIGLNRRVRDTTFVEWNTRFDARLRLFENIALIGSISRKTVYPDSTASRQLRLMRQEVINSEIGIEYDTRDYAPNPRSGLFYSSAYIYGFKNNFGPAYIFAEDSVKKKEDLQSIKLTFAWYYNLWTNQVLALELNGMQIKGDRLQISDLFWFGGSRTLRGYRENQFRGDVVAWINGEYRFILGRNSRLFVFSDWGVYQDLLGNQKANQWLPGYGLGIRFETPLGILGVDYGLGKGDGFGEGKIHFGIVNRF